MPVIVSLDDQSIPDVFLPEHLRFSAAAGNWAAYKHAIETVCRLKGVAENLAVGARGLAGGEELCKAIVTLNIKDFPAYGIPAGEDVHARTVWARLCELHRPKRTCSRLTERVRTLVQTWSDWGLAERVRTLTWSDLAFFFLLCVLVFLLDQPRPQREVCMAIPILPPVEYYRNLLRDSSDSC